MLSKILGALLCVAVIGCGILGWKYHSLQAENDSLQAKIVVQNVEVTQLNAQIVSIQAQESFKAKELAQTNDLLNTCYRALSGQIEDFNTIQEIMQLPARERTNECNPDQDAACLDFLNRQLLDVK